jgi:hypothetical protein
MGYREKGMWVFRISPFRQKKRVFWSNLGRFLSISGVQFGGVQEGVFRGPEGGHFGFLGICQIWGQICQIWGSKRVRFCRFGGSKRVCPGHKKVPDADFAKALGFKRG